MKIKLLMIGLLFCVSVDAAKPKRQKSSEEQRRRNLNRARICKKRSKWLQTWDKRFTKGGKRILEEQSFADLTELLSEVNKFAPLCIPLKNALLRVLYRRGEEVTQIGVLDWTLKTTRKAALLATDPDERGILEKFQTSIAENGQYIYQHDDYLAGLAEARVQYINAQSDEEATAILLAREKEMRSDLSKWSRQRTALVHSRARSRQNMRLRFRRRAALVRGARPGRQ